MKLLALSVLIIVLRVECEMFSSTDELASLSVEQKFVIEAMEELLERLKEEVKVVERKLTSMKAENLKMDENPQKYVEIPLNTFLLIKSLSYDVESIQNSFNETFNAFLAGIDAHRLPMTDFEGSVEGLQRLQITYELKSEDLADGILDGVKYREKLSSDELYALGSEMADAAEDLAEVYLKIAIERSKDELEKIQIYEKLFAIYYDEREYKKAVEILDKLIEIEPENEELKSVRIEVDLKGLFEDEKDRAQWEESKQSALGDLSGTHRTFFKETKIFSQSCMGKRLQHASVISKLFCRYHTTNSFTKIAPFKLEIVNNHPFVGIFHDVIANDEIEKLKLWSNPRLTRAKVISNVTNQYVTLNRVAKLGFVWDVEDELFVRISRRVEDMSGLSAETGEVLQIQNYGIGGHYSLHHDFTFEGQDFGLGTGNRILTALFYLSNVEKGGATVFPFLRLYVPPKKGTAVLWHNLSTSGHREYKTLHGACPVIAGSKWVANKWLHEAGQERTRPCELHSMLTDEDFNDIYWIY